MNKKFIKIFVTMLFFSSVLLICINYIYVYIDAKLNGSYIVKNTKGFELGGGEDDVYYGIEPYILNGIGRKMSIKGWSFVESEEESVNRYIKIYFISDNKKYVVNTFIIKLSSAAFFWRHYKNHVPDAIDFITEFSTLNMSDGIYHIWFETYENEKNYGVVDTGKILNIKNGFLSMDLSPKINIDISKPIKPL